MHQPVRGNAITTVFYSRLVSQTGVIPKSKQTKPYEKKNNAFALCARM